jgi:hypothetical protein
MIGPLEAGYEARRIRQGLGAADNQAETGILTGIGISIAIVTVAMLGLVAFLWWLGSMQFWR